MAGQNRVVISRRTPLFDCVIVGAWFAIFGFMLVMVFTVGSHEISPNPVARLLLFGILGVPTLIFGALLVKKLYAGKATFDAGSGTVEFRRTFGKTRTVRFDEIARIAPLYRKGLFASALAYCVVLKEDPFFGYIPLTSYYRANGGAMRDFQNKQLPEIVNMLDLPEASASSVAAPAPGFSLPGHEREGSAYKLRAARKALMCFAGGAALLPLAGLIVQAEMEDAPVLAVLVFALGAYLIFQAACKTEISRTIDPNKRTIESTQGLVFRRTVKFSFDDIEHVESAIYEKAKFFAGRTISVKFKNAKRPIVLVNGGAPAAIRAKVDAYSSLLGIDLAANVRYVQKKV